MGSKKLEFKKDKKTEEEDEIDLNPTSFYKLTC